MNIDGMGTDFTASHAAALCAQLPRCSRVSVANDPAKRWGEFEYTLALIEFDLQCIAMRGAKHAKPRMMRTPIDDARLERARKSIDKDELADKLGIPEGRR